MDQKSLSVLSPLRAKPVGKVKRRVRELRSSSAACYGGGAGPSTLDLSHSEVQRLAVDALMGEAGVPGYRQLLTTEGEVDFLSEREKSYILTNRQDGHVGSDSDPADVEDEHAGSHQGPLMSLGPFSASEESADDSQNAEPSLRFGSLNGMELSGSDPQSQSRVEVFLQSDNREGSMKDLIREQIRKAQTALAVVVDTFSDVELLCDILEASSKRGVCVYLLLDHLNVRQFLDMCRDLNVDGKHFPKLSVRSVSGLRYCTTTGRKLSGQVTETFIISDWTQVLTGSYSFSWLSWQVNRTFIVLLEGRSVTSFHQEFRRLYLSSRPLPPLFPAALTPTRSASHGTQKNSSDPATGRSVKSGKTETEAVIPSAAEPTHCALSLLEVEHNRAETYVMALALWRENSQHRARVEVGNVGAERPKRTPQAYASNPPPADFACHSFPRAYRQHNGGGMDARRPLGASTLRAQASPHARGKPMAAPWHQDINGNSRAAMELRTAANTRLRVDSPAVRRSLSQSQMHAQGNAQSLYIRTQSHRQWPAVQLSPQNGACGAQSPRHLISSRHHLWPGAAFLPDTGTDIKSQAKPQIEPWFSVAGAKGPPQDAQKYTNQQFAPSQRLHWISQLHTRERAHNVPGVNGTLGRRVVEETGQRDGKRGAGVVTRGRTGGALGRPASLH